MQQLLCGAMDCGELEKERDWEAAPNRGGESVSDLESHERIEPELVQRPMGRKFARGVQAEDLCDVSLNEIQSGLLALVRSELAETRRERCRGRQSSRANGIGAVE